MIHAALALSYAAITPFLQPGYSNGQLLDDIGAPDEFAHIGNIRHLLANKEMPILDARSPDAKFLYEAHQPPLFYVLDAGFFRLWGKDPVEGPGIALRGLNAIFGSGIVVGVYFFALWAGTRKLTCLAVAAVTALLPMLCALDGAVSNDPLMILVSTWSLALMVRWRSQWDIRRIVAVGFLIGLGLLVKSSAILLLPTFALSILTGSNRRWAHLGTGLIAVALIGGPWLIRNQVVYGDPLGMSAFYAYFPRNVDPAEVFSGIRPFAHWAYVLLSGAGLSFVGIFGYMDIHLPYALYLPILVLIGLGLLVAAIRRGNERPRWEIGLFVMLLLGAFVSYNLWQVQPQARYILPAIAPICLWIVVGLERTFAKANVFLPGFLLGLLMIANVWALMRLPGEFRQRVEAARERGAVSPLRIP